MVDSNLHRPLRREPTTTQSIETHRMLHCCYHDNSPTRRMYLRLTGYHPLLPEIHRDFVTLRYKQRVTVQLENAQLFEFYSSRNLECLPVYKQMGMSKHTGISTCCWAEPYEDFTSIRTSSPDSGWTFLMHWAFTPAILICLPILIARDAFFLDHVSNGVYRGRSGTYHWPSESDQK